MPADFRKELVACAKIGADMHRDFPVHRDDL